MSESDSDKSQTDERHAPRCSDELTMKSEDESSGEESPQGEESSQGDESQGEESSQQR